MREFIDIFFRVCNVIAAIGCLIASIVSFIKGDVLHITLAYYAASYVLFKYAEKE